MRTKTLAQPMKWKSPPTPLVQSVMIVRGSAYKDSALVTLLANTAEDGSAEVGSNGFSIAHSAFTDIAMQIS
jgi:hypothetical protein